VGMLTSASVPAARDTIRAAFRKHVEYMRGLESIVKPFPDSALLTRLRARVSIGKNPDRGSVEIRNRPERHGRISPMRQMVTVREPLPYAAPKRRIPVEQSIPDCHLRIRKRYHVEPIALYLPAVLYERTAGAGNQRAAALS
jgi:hypothetical protein